MAIYSKSNTFAANTVISSTNVNQNFDEISTAINTTLAGGGNAIIPTKGGTGLTSYVTGDLSYASATNVLSNRAIGTAGQTLQVLNGVPTWQNVSSGAKNYITYKDFENNATTGWGLGTTTLTSFLPTGAPTFGSGASGNLTLSATSSGKLAGAYSLSLASSAATTAGNFIASDALTIDIEDQSKVLAFKFYYSPTVNPTNANWSGTTSNSFGVAIYDVTNSAWIIPAGIFNLVQNSGVGICQGTFQTPSNMTSCRLVIYNANATTNSITMLYDDFYLGPQALAFGAAVSDWTAYTPTFSAGFGTVTLASGFYLREGDSVLIKASCTTGTVAGSVASITLPSGLVIDTSKISIANTSANPGAEIGVFHGSGLASSNGAVVTATGTSSTLVYLGGLTSGTAILTPANGSTVMANTSVFSCVFKVPVSGWSSNTSLSADTDTRVVQFNGNLNYSTALTGTPAKIPFTSVNDTHGGYLTDTYTIPVTGRYRIAAVVALASTGTGAGRINAYKNGSIANIGGVQTITNTFTTQLPAIGELNCNAGDTIDVRADAISGTLAGGGVAVGMTTLAISRISGPAVVAASESVNARYYASVTSISGSLATINWTTKDFDTHSAMSAGTYTIPITGKYQINAGLGMTGTYALNNLLTTEIQKNGTVVSRVKNYAAAAVTQLDSQISDTISCLAGDTIRIQVSNGCTSPVIVTSNFENYMSLERIGN